MEHTILIWSKDKDGKNFSIRTRVKLNQQNIEDIALDIYKSSWTLDDDLEYFAELESTTH